MEQFARIMVTVLVLGGLLAILPNLAVESAMAGTEATGSSEAEQKVAAETAPQTTADLALLTIPAWPNCNLMGSKATCEATICGNHGITCDWDGQWKTCTCPGTSNRGQVPTSCLPSPSENKDE